MATKSLIHDLALSQLARLCSPARFHASHSVVSPLIYRADGSSGNQILSRRSSEREWYTEWNPK